MIKDKKKIKKKYKLFNFTKQNHIVGISILKLVRRIIQMFMMLNKIIDFYDQQSLVFFKIS